MHDGRQWNSTLKRRTPLRAKTPLAKSGSEKLPNKFRSFKKKGKKTLAWEAARKRLKVAFKQAGITTCELNMAEKCWRDNGLGFAHTLKRRNITTEEGLLRVCLACNPCHDEIEALGQFKMAEIVGRVILTRPVPVVF